MAVPLWTIFKTEKANLWRQRKQMLGSNPDPNLIFLSPEQDSGRILLRQGAPKNAGMPKRMLLHDTFFRTLWRADVHWHCNTTPYRSSLGFVGDVRILMGYVNGNTDNGIPILKADGCDMTRKCRNQSCVRQSQEDRTREDPSPLWNGHSCCTKADVQRHRGPIQAFPRAVWWDIQMASETHSFDSAGFDMVLRSLAIPQCVFFSSRSSAVAFLWLPWRALRVCRRQKQWASGGKRQTPCQGAMMCHGVDTGVDKTW